MNLTIGGKGETVELKAKTVAELLKVKNVEMPEMVSVELNGRILRQAEYGTTELKDGDEVEFLYFMGGGQACSMEFQDRILTEPLGEIQ